MRHEPFIRAKFTKHDEEVIELSSMVEGEQENQYHTDLWLSWVLRTRWQS